MDFTYNFYPENKYNLSNLNDFFFLEIWQSKEILFNLGISILLECITYISFSVLLFNVI